jgi:hypothetical protein
MKQGSTLFLKGTVLFIGLITLGLCVFALPPFMINSNAETYRPIIIGLYVAAIPFFIALHQAVKLLSYIETKTAFSTLSVKALERIKYCATIISTLFVLGSPYIYIRAELDDAPGLLAVSLVIIFASFIIATFAAVLQELLTNVIAIKSENDLTV